VSAEGEETPEVARAAETSHLEMAAGCTSDADCSARLAICPREECEALAARCTAEPREARWDETLPRFRSEGDLAGQCYVRCGGWPE